MDVELERALVELEAACSDWEDDRDNRAVSPAHRAANRLRDAGRAVCDLMEGPGEPVVRGLTIDHERMAALQAELAAVQTMLDQSGEALIGWHRRAAQAMLLAVQTTRYGT